ncbi:MAG: methyl-accepting chemotaxis protein [Chloroflexi bacterium]|nr:methyl-accepting chemotaxis protein [Chloroflexota bacterium]
MAKMKSRTSFVQFGLQQRQMAWMTMAVTIPLVILAAIAVRTVEQDMMDQAEQKVASDLNVASFLFYGKGTRVEILDGKMALDSSYVVNGNPEIVDAVARLVGGNATVFQGDTRISTTLKREDGGRAIGTRAAENVVDTVLRQEHRYVGRAWVVNDWYITAYDPIRDPSGKVIGMLFVGTLERPFVEVADAFRNRTLLVGGLGLLLALFIGWISARSLSRPVQAMTAAAKAIAEGEVGQTMELDEGRGDELGDMARAFRRMVTYVQEKAAAAERIAARDLTEQAEPSSDHDVLGVAFYHMVAGLRDLTIELQAAAESISSAANEIMTAVSQLASGATEQAAAVTQTTATVDEVGASAKQAVEMAMVVSEAAQQASRAASEGVVAVRDATQGMADIRQKAQSIAVNILALSEQSQRIGEIIATVNDLADQSNLLALNAAIEASRAGEHGKGFAVVASEIRSLAEQSKAATAQVRTILSDIQRATNAAVMATEQGTKGVDSGMQLIDRAGRTIDELAELVRQASQSAAQIAASVRQHSVGMQQITAAMVNIDQAATESLAATGNTKRAAENLTDLAGRLNGLLAQYRVAAHGGDGQRLAGYHPEPNGRRHAPENGRESDQRGRALELARGARPGPGR